MHFRCDSVQLQSTQGYKTCEGLIKCDITLKREMGMRSMTPIFVKSASTSNDSNSSL